MFEWYAELPRWLKVTVSLVVLAISAGLSVNNIFWPWGWGVGVVLFIAAFTIDD